MGMNLFVQATNQGKPPPRTRLLNDTPLDSSSADHGPKSAVPTRVEPANPPSRTTSGPLRVALASHEGNWRPEPLAWAMLDRFLRQHRDFGVRIGAEGEQPESDGGLPLASLSRLDPQRVPLAHLSGVEPVALNPEQLSAIVDYARAGGTVLVETVGGRGRFAADVQLQLSAFMDERSYRIDTRHPIYTGRDLPGAFFSGRVYYRRFAHRHRPIGSRPQLEAIHLADRPAVIFSLQDLSQGLVGVRRWRIDGPKPLSARKLVINIALWAERAARRR
jgi:hypothetical protein